MRSLRVKSLHNELTYREQDWTKLHRFSQVGLFVFPSAWSFQPYPCIENDRSFLKQRSNKVTYDMGLFAMTLDP